MDDAHIFHLVDKLATDDAKQAENVKAELVALGSEAIPALGRAIERAALQWQRLDKKSRWVNYDVPQQVMRVLAAFGAAAVPALVNFLRRDGILGLAAFAAFDILRHSGISVVAEIRPLLRDSLPLVRARAADLLGSLQGTALDAYDEIEQLTNDPDEEVQKKAILAAAWIGGTRSLPVLKRIWNSGRLQIEVIDAYATIGCELMENAIELEAFARQVVPDLITALRSKDYYSESANALAYMGAAPTAHEAIPALIEALEFELESDVICEALSCMQTQAAWPAAEALRSISANIRFGATRVLHYFTWYGRCDDNIDAETVYIQKLVSRKCSERLLACNALKTMRTATRRSIEPLQLLLLREVDQEVWDAANEALKALA